MRWWPEHCPLSYVQLRAASRRDYVPNFKTAFERFLLHTGGRGVIESIQEGLSLSPKDCQASYDTLYRFGNTSAASTWCAHLRAGHACRTPGQLPSMEIV